MAERLDFQVVDCMSEEEGFKPGNLLDIGPTSKGWLSAKYCIYPQTMILQLPNPAHIRQMQILGSAWAVPTQCDIFVGEVAKNTNREKKNAYFMKIGTITPESNQANGFKARQLISLEIANDGRACPVSFVKLVFYKNYQNKMNQYNQVGITALSLIGRSNQEGSKRNFNLDEVLSPYEELSFLVYTDTEVAQLIQKLDKRKVEALSTERLEYAKKIREAIEELVEAGGNLGTLQIEKQILTEREDYDEARSKKNQIEEYRIEVYKSLEILDLLEVQGGSRNH